MYLVKSLSELLGVRLRFRYRDPSRHESRAASNRVDKVHNTARNIVAVAEIAAARSLDTAFSPRVISRYAGYVRHDTPSGVLIHGIRRVRRRSTVHSTKEVLREGFPRRDATELVCAIVGTER